MSESPTHQASGAGRGGIVPPAEKRWKPGQSGNPKGRPNAGAAVREWLNVMQSWTLERIRGVLTDPKARANKVAAARIWVHACCEDRSSAGLPIAGGEIDRVMDRTLGKPVAEDLLTRLEKLEALLSARETDARRN